MSYDLWPLFLWPLKYYAYAPWHIWLLGINIFISRRPHCSCWLLLFQLSKLADVQNLHICCFHSARDLVLLRLPAFLRHFSVGISLPLAGICLPFRFGTICHWQAVILWLVSWVCLPVCPASLWTPTSARVDFKGSLAGFRAPRHPGSLSPFLSLSLCLISDWYVAGFVAVVSPF